MSDLSHSPKPMGRERRASISVPLGLSSEEDAARLATLGYKQELKRNFNTVEIFGFAFSVIGLMPSIASTLVFSLPAGPVAMVWGWFLACGGVFIVALAMADLASAMPTSGGLYWCGHYFASESTRRPLSFLVGYSNTIAFIAGICSIDYSFSLIFLSVIAISTDGAWTPTNGTIYGVFVATVIIHATLASTTNKYMGKFQTLFIILNLIIILATIIALPVGRSINGTPRNDAAYIFTDLENFTTWPIGWAFMLGWLSPIWTVSGIDSCVHMSEEAKNAAIAAPYGILMAVGSAWVLGFVILIVISACISPDIASVLGTPFGQPMAQIYFDALGKSGTLGLMSLLTVVQFSMGLSVIVATSRQSWAFSRDGALPFSSFFRQISPRFGFIPLRTIWGSAFAAIIIGLLSLIAPAAAQALFSIGVTGNNFAWMMPIFARVWWGRGKFVPGPFYTGDRWSVGVAWAAVVFLVFGIVLAMFPVGGPDPTPAVMNYCVVINGAVWLGALVYYAVDARKWFVGPVNTLEEAGGQGGSAEVKKSRVEMTGKTE